MQGLYVKQGQDIMRDDAGIGPVKVAEVHAGHREEREKLALLFAAAPDLLAALDGLLDGYQNAGGKYTPAERMARVHAARKALKLARGEG